jgi:hypothetical protein
LIFNSNFESNINTFEANFDTKSSNFTFEPSFEANFDTNFDTNLKDAYLEYSEFCNTNNIKESCKIEFNKRLEAYKITSYKSGNIHNKFNYKHAKLEEIAVANKWKHPTDQYDNGDQFIEENNLDSGINKDDEIKALKEAGERLDHAKIRAHVIARLHIESLDSESSPASRIRALELLGKLGGVAAFEKQAEDNTLPQDADSVSKALKAKLESLMKTGT